MSTAEREEIYDLSAGNEDWYLLLNDSSTEWTHIFNRSDSHIVALNLNRL
jgi:hypothetical protein